VESCRVPRILPHIRRCSYQGCQWPINTHRRSLANSTELRSAVRFIICNRSGIRHLHDPSFNCGDFCAVFRRFLMLLSAQAVAAQPQIAFRLLHRGGPKSDLGDPPRIHPRSLRCLPTGLEFVSVGTRATPLTLDRRIPLQGELGEAEMVVYMEHEAWCCPVSCRSGSCCWPLTQCVLSHYFRLQLLRGSTLPRFISI
jgi:hypothetical protein